VSFGASQLLVQKGTMMAIKVIGTEVISDARELKNVASYDSAFETLVMASVNASYDTDKIQFSSSDYVKVNDTTIDFYLDGVLDMQLTNAGDLHVDGNITAYSTTTSSDINLKQNIAHITDPWQYLDGIDGYTYNFIKDGKESAGVIAQQVEKVLPSAVGEDNKGFKSVDYNQIIGVLVAAVKDLKEAQNGSTN
jgi:cell division protein ZapA (FtsZ GTPase activity inhibitor)